MLTKEQYKEGVQCMLEMFDKAGIVLTDAEKENIEIVDYDLEMIEEVGLQLVTYVNTEKCCAKEMMLRPWQTSPEHYHPDGVENGVPYEGKEETFRCRYGLCYLYVAGPGKIEDIHGKVPPTTTTVYNEIILHPGEQYTIYPNTMHWFQGGPEGAVISEFSTRSTDETDIFTDKKLIREAKIED